MNTATIAAIIVASVAGFIGLQMGIIKWLVADRLADIQAQLRKRADSHDEHTGKIHGLDKRVNRIEIHLGLEA